MRFEMPPPVNFTTGFPGLPEGRPSARPANVRAKEFRASLRRRAQLKRAAEVLPHLPGPGESLHALLTGTFDFLLVLNVVIRSHGAPCDTLRLATLAFSRRNTQELCRLIDDGFVNRLVLLASDFMARANPGIYGGAVEELAVQRGQVVGSARTHAKVSLLHFADGLKLTFEGSGNLRTNGNIEQVTAINDPELHDWHAQWIDERVRDHEGDQSRCAATG
jgi:hypothetical protein